MKERKLILDPQFEGIYVREEGDVVLSGDTIVKGNTHISTQQQANKVFKPASTKHHLMKFHYNLK